MKKLITFFAVLTMTLAAQAKLITKSVPYEHDGVKLEGYLAYEESGHGQRPGIVVFPEWWGLNGYAKERAEALAKLGYVAFAADMYGVGVTTEEATRARELSGQFYGKPLMATRARAALDQLVKTGLVDESRLAAIGYCFGGAVSQALAYSGAPIIGMVSFHGGLIPAPVDALEKNHTHFLILHGALDPMSSPDDVRAFKQSLDAAKADYQFIFYSGAVHAFTNPDADRLCALNGLKGIGYNETAARRSWQQMQSFFNEIFAKNGKGSKSKG